MIKKWKKNKLKSKKVPTSDKKENTDNNITKDVKKAKKISKLKQKLQKEIVISDVKGNVKKRKQMKGNKN